MTRAADVDTIIRIPLVEKKIFLIGGILFYKYGVGLYQDFLQQVDNEVKLMIADSNCTSGLKKFTLVTESAILILNRIVPGGYSGVNPKWTSLKFICWI